MNNKSLSTNHPLFISLYVRCGRRSVEVTEGSKKEGSYLFDIELVTSVIFAQLAKKNMYLIQCQRIAIGGEYSAHFLLECSREKKSIEEALYNLEVDVTSSLDALGVSAQPQFLSYCSESNSDFNSKSNNSLNSNSNRFVITLMAAQISAAFLSSIVTLLADNKSLLCSINCLSDDAIVVIGGSVDKAYGLEVFINDVSGMALLRDQLEALGSQQSVDVSVQPDTALRTQKRLACFDMDSTLIQAEVIDELAKEAGVGAQVAAITESAMRGEIDFNQSFIQRMSLLEGLDESVLEQVARRLVLSDGVEVLFAALNRLGYKTAILSGGFDYFGRFLQKKLGIDYVHANELNIVDGKVTGNVLGDIVNGDKKAEFLQKIASKENIKLEQVVAVGDGANDLPMLAVAGLGIAYKAKPLVKASASYSIDHVGLDGLLYMLGLSTSKIHHLVKP